LTNPLGGAIIGDMKDYYASDNGQSVQVREVGSNQMWFEIHCGSYGGVRSAYVSGDNVIVETNSGQHWVYSASKRQKLR
jgi:hypothetical protein